MGLFDSNAIKLTEQGLDACWYKQKVISHNISNIDTPDYKAKTVDFGIILKNALNCPYHVEKNSSAAESAEAGSSYLTPYASFYVNTTYETNTNQILDGNNVDIEKESLSLADAQYQYSTMIDYMNTQYAMIRTAIGK